MSKGSQRKRIETNGAEEEPKLDAARELRGIYFTSDDDPDHEDVKNKARGKLKLKTSEIVHGSSAGVTPNRPHSSHMSASGFSTIESI